MTARSALALALAMLVMLAIMAALLEAAASRPVVIVLTRRPQAAESPPAGADGLPHTPAESDAG